MPRKTKESTAKSTPQHTGARKTIQKARTTNVFDINSLVPTSSTSSTSSTFKHRTQKESKAEFSVFEAEYQKGEKKGQKSGNIYMNGKCRFGRNKVYKEKVNKLLLTEQLRWNDDKKTYHAKLCSYEQAVMVLEASKMVHAEDESDLADVTIDRSLFKVPHVHIFPLELEMKEQDEKVPHTVIAGITFPWKDKLKEAGFTVCYALNGVEGATGWLAEAAKVAEVKDELIKDFKKYGWTVNEHDGAA